MFGISAIETERSHRDRHLAEGLEAVGRETERPRLGLRDVEDQQVVPADDLLKGGNSGDRTCLDVRP